MLKAHYEKIVLLISVLAALVLGLMPLFSSFFSGADTALSFQGSTKDSFSFGQNEAGLQTLELFKETSIMPGDTITFVFG
jgi:hypothetical protein